MALLRRHLSRAGYELIFERVETPETMRAALKTKEWDVILCDYSMPHFNAVSALALLKEIELDIPFIIISGTIGEELAVEAMRAGANDYLMKDNLARLAPTIEREMHEAENRRARRRAEAELRQSEARYRRLIDTASEGIWIADARAHITYANQRLAEMLGYSVEEMIGRSAFEVLDDATRAEMKVNWKRRLQGIEEQYDLRLWRKDGSALWVILSATPIRDEQGQVTGALAMLTDITKRRRAEQLVRLQATALESADNAILISGHEGTITWVNPAFSTLTGYAPEEVLGQNPRILKSNQHEPPFFESMWKSLLSGQVWRGEIINRRKDGSVYFEEQTITPVLDDAGEITNFIAIKQDITERKQTEEEKAQFAAQIEAQRQRLNNIVASVPGVVWESWGEPDAATQRTDFVSDYVETMLGYSVKEWLSTPNFWLSIVHPDDRERTARAAAADFAGGKSSNTLEFRWVARDGRVLWVQSISAVITDAEGRPVGLRGVTIDISESKRAEEAVRHAEEMYRSIFENAVEGIFQSTTDGKFISVNPAMARILGYESPEELMTHRTDIGTQHYVDENSRAELERMLAVHGVAVGYECEVYRKDRSRIWTRENVRAMSDEGGAVLYYEGSIEDFTERKHAEDWLAAQYAVTRALADSTTLADATPNILRAICETFGWAWGALWTVDAEADVLRCRDIWLDPSVEMPQFEQTSRELTFAPGVGLPGRVWATGQLAWVSDVIQEKNFPRAQIAVKENLHSALAIPIPSRSGVLGVMEFFSRVIREPEPELLAMMATITSQIGQFIERKRAEEALRKSEEQLQQSQKLEAIGMLAGGIAHDFNNLLTVIAGYSDLTLVQLREEDPLRGNINEVKKAAERAAALTRQLLAFSRKQVLQPKVLDLNAVVSELEKLLRRLIGEDIGFRTVLESALGSVKADPGQIEQIIMNLAVNARDAMPRGGKLTIETKNVDLDEYYAKKHIAIIPGPYVMLAVSDTGTGMDQQTQARIFDPFFTTKETGKGTGLGLSTVYGIVKQSGGNIWVYSEVGRGTSFKVYLPRVDEGAEEYKRSAETQVDFRGPETVLVAEDEEMVRKLACKVLEMSGYRVLEAANGGAALLICERHNEPIHLLITDVIMPEMSGRELADRLAQLRPTMKVLYMSGYTDNAIVHHGVLNEGANFIQKPFATHALARKVREVLDASK